MSSKPLKKGRLRSGFGIQNPGELSRKMEQLKKNAEKAERAVLSDFRSRVPPMVVQAVTGRYTIQRGQVTGKFTKSNKKPKKVIGSITAKGKTIGTVRIEYRGRPLQLTYFNLSPRTPNKGSYTMQAEIVKGNKKPLGKVRKLNKRERKKVRRGVRTSKRSPVMLVPSSKKQESSGYIPIQRRSYDRKDIHTVKGLSLPMMVDSRHIRAEIDPKIETIVMKRLDRQLKRYGLKEK